MATKPLILVFDTETTGLPPRGENNVSASSDLEKWPIIVQLAFLLFLVLAVHSTLQLVLLVSLV